MAGRGPVAIGLAAAVKAFVELTPSERFEAIKLVERLAADLRSDRPPS